jgi:large subunit ribosomal protein L3
MLGIIGKKLGMTQVYNKEGQPVPVTVVEVLPAWVLALKTQDKDGYQAIQVATGSRKEKHLTKPEAGHFKKAGVAPAKWVAEFRLDDLAGWEVGKQYDASIFNDDKKVSVTGTSKGKGFAGTIKRYNFSRGPETHGSKNVRAPGSMGAHSYPARVFPGKRLGGHMGMDTQTTKNLELVKIDLENGLLFIKGAVPGGTNGRVIVRKQNG